MNEVGTSLTMTGLIATVVSVLFAIAALYVSHRRRVHPGSNTAAPYVSQPIHITPTPPRKPATPIPMAHPKPAHPEPEPTVSPSAFNVAPGSAPLFKKLGGDNPTPKPVQSVPAEKKQYVWE